jgi:hypothetical protein
VTEVPSRIGPAELACWAAGLTVRCAPELGPPVRQAGEAWDPGARLRLVERRRLGPRVRRPKEVTDPLFRRMGIDLDG